ncbi:MAG TPA: VCBS repeat-containing protein, partial [Candidatus Latescibacteria bacterium]|nr:VCBS repeat-containing protein [Candidatus Latescibacterota bacterium]
DNDGDLDLVITGMERNGTSLTRLYRNTDGILLLDEGNSEALINAHNGDLAWGDVDNDGDLDLALSGENIIPEGGLYNVTEFYLNDPPGTLSLAANLVLIDNDSGDPLQIRRGSLAWADYDEDGNLDLAVSGRDPWFNAVLKLYRNRPAGTLTEDSGFSMSSTQRVDGALDWIDYDNDGDPDLAVTGRTKLSAHRAVVFDNRGGSVVGVSVEEDNLVGLSGGTALWADYSGDGRVDLLITGVDEGGERRSLLYDNLGTPDANRNPDSPRSLNPAKVTGSRVLFSWTAGEDVESSILTYNIRIGTEEGLDDILSSSVALGPGNTGFKSDFLLERLLTAKPRYFWNVQSVDGAFARSDFLPSDEVFAIEQFVSSEQRVRDLQEA